MKNEKFEEFIQHCVNALPKDFLQFRQDVEKQLRAALLAAFQKMDLITREEFDVQARLLSRTRERLEAMHERLERMEQADTEQASMEQADMGQADMGHTKRDKIAE